MLFDNRFEEEFKRNDKYFITTYSYRNNKEYLIFNLSNYEILYNDELNLIKISYLIQVFDANNNSILPSDLTLYFNMNIFCFINIDTINITSLAGIENNKYFKCVEFFKLKEKIQIGFTILKTKNQKERTSIVVHKYIYNYIPNKSFPFNISKIVNEYKFLLSQLKNNNSKIETTKLKKLYISKPFNSLKRNVSKYDNQWNFANLFNEYFCFCKGSKCLNINITQICKYNFYIYLIDYNHHIYKKTDYLLMDFIFKRYTSADVYPIFESMIKRNISAHYFTERKDIYEKYCKNYKFCDLIIPANARNYKINGDFLEKYFSLILKLKQVLSSVGINIDFVNNIFYNIDYITYICIGHGVSYFKSHLYNYYYGPQNFDKLLIPNSEKLILEPIKYGWKYENLIKFNLPRWDKFNILNESINEKGKIKTNSIFIMFTFRALRKGKKISKYYVQNIVDLLNNKKMINNFEKKNFTLYFSLHHTMLKIKSNFKYKNNVKYIYENDISECLSKIKLLVTDYSSIIFDVIYRKKPYIIFIPDANDSSIKENYQKHSYEIINKFKNNYFGFENVFFDLNSALNKINYYIDNNFQLDKKLEKFYDEFNFKKGSIINDLINFLEKM